MSRSFKADCTLMSVQAHPVTMNMLYVMKPWERLLLLFWPPDMESDSTVRTSPKLTHAMLEVEL